MQDAEILPAPDISVDVDVVASKWNREKRAFHRLLPTLIASHDGEYVAVRDEQVVGSGRDQLELARETYRRFVYVPIYVGLVSDAPPVPIRMPSPRVLRQSVDQDVN